MQGRNVILAVDMGGTAWKAAVMSEGRALAFASMPNRSVVDDLSQLAALFRHLLKESGSSLKACPGLDISLAEIVDSNAKICPSPCYKHPYFQGNDVESIVRNYIDLPVEIDNDSRASLLTDAVRQGDSHARQGLGEFSEVWTALLVSLIHAFWPAHMALSGGFSRSADLFLPGVLDSVRKRLWDPELMPDVHIPDEPELSGLRGGEVLVRRADI